jgi:hypothetical protein
MSNLLVWIVGLLSLLALVVLAPFVVLVIAATLFGGVSFGVAAFVIGMSAGQEVLNQSAAFAMTAAGLSAAFALAGVARRLVKWARQGALPPLMVGLSLIAKQLFTFHLFAQIGIGSGIATLAVVLFAGDVGMPPLQLLVVSLFSLFVFIVSATFSSYFMRAFIPWRKEHPNFSNSVAYALSVILGLIAAAIAYTGKDTFDLVSKIGNIYYQAALALGSLGATVVGAYIAGQQNAFGGFRTNRPDPPPTEPSQDTHA